MDTERGHPASLPTWVVLLVLSIAGAWGGLRGPALAVRGGGDDFALIYISARAWLFGQNPYDGTSLDGLWAQAGGSEALSPTVRGPSDLLYPPMSFPLLSPVAAMPWPIAQVVWMLLNIGAFGIGLFALMRWVAAPRTIRHPVTLAIVGAALCFGPVHTGIRMGQTTLLVFACLCAAHAIRVSGKVDRQVIPGILLGIAAVIKPQFGVPFLVYELFSKRIRSASVGFGLAGGIAAVAFARLHLADIDWLPTLTENVRLFASVGAGNPSRTNPFRYQMIDLQVLCQNGVIPPRMLVLAITGLVALAGAIAWHRAREGRSELLGVSLGVGLCLMIVYHRYYDATLLLIPVAWAITTLPRARLVPITLLAAIAPFAIPGGAALYVAADRGIIPNAITSTALWTDGLLLHQAWLVPVITAITVIGLWRTRSEDGAETKGASQVDELAGVRPHVEDHPAG